MNDQDDYWKPLMDSLRAIYAKQDKAEKSRALHARLEDHVTQMSALRAKAAAKYGDPAMMQARMSMRPGMLWSRVSFDVWPEE